MSANASDHRPDDDGAESGPVNKARPSSKSSSAKRSQVSAKSDESTPLLSRSDDIAYGNELESTAEPSQAATPSIHATDDSPKKGFFRRRWPTLVALATLTIVMLIILALGFATPALVEEYAQQAATFEPTNLSIYSFTAKGVNARVQGSFMLDASRV